MVGILGVTVAAILARLAVETGLILLNLRELRRRAGTVPEALATTMDEATYARAGAYARARLRFSLASGVWDTAVLAVVLFSGLLPWAWAAWTGWLGAGAWAGAGFLVAFMLAMSLPDLPWSWWGQFRIEARFGFNRASPGLWVVDRIKGVVLVAALGVPLLALLIFVVEQSGPLWWLWAWAVLMVIKLVLAVAVPWLIMPLFNRFTPLEDAGLRERLMSLAERGRFHAQSIHVMDGSRRSAHSNALFTGLGRFRRIVLFDTLLAQLQPAEIEAVLAHEIGHYRRGHIWKGLALGAVVSLAAFLLIGWLMGTPVFFQAFGFEEPAVAVAFLLFALLGGVFFFWMDPLLNALSRRHEYEADAFARELTGSPDPMVRALQALARENLSNPTPHPAYSAFHHSHPTLLERVAALRRAPAAPR